MNYAVSFIGVIFIGYLIALVGTALVLRFNPEANTTPLKVIVMILFLAVARSVGFAGVINESGFISHFGDKVVLENGLISLNCPDFGNSFDQSGLLNSGEDGYLEESDGVVDYLKDNSCLFLTSTTTGDFSICVYKSDLFKKYSGRMNELAKELTEDIDAQNRALLESNGVTIYNTDSYTKTINGTQYFVWEMDAAYPYGKVCQYMTFSGENQIILKSLIYDPEDVQNNPLLPEEIVPMVHINKIHTPVLWVLVIAVLGGITYLIFSVLYKRAQLTYKQY